MVDDAQARLNDAGWNLEEEIFLSGFSASGFFANRFATIYPERVRAMFAGAPYYVVMPEASIEGHALTYPLGTSDYATLFGDAFNKAAYQQTPKLYYIGERDSLDPLGIALNGYHPTHRTIAYDLFGEGTFFDRFDAMIETYYDVGGNMIFMVGQGVDHRMLSSHRAMVSNFFAMNRNHDGCVFDFSQYTSSIDITTPPTITCNPE